MSASARTSPAAVAHPPVPTHPLTVGVLGAGRVGAALGAALLQAGHRVVAASGRSARSSERIATLLPGARHVDAVEVARAATDLLIIAVPDDALGPVVAHLAEEKAFTRGQVVAHTSGAHGTGILHPAVAQGAWPLALHPAMTFTGRRDDATRLAGISYGVTAPEELRPVAQALVRDLGGIPEWISDAERPLYHAALTHGANHLVTLVNESLDRLREAGVAHPERALGPLLRAALENALALGDAALTGPVSRGDAGTVARHLDALAAVAPESVPGYLALARRTADRAITAGRLTPAAAEPLLGVLGGAATVDGRP
jgi:predicted short-subunit dehydrogenase-like oxidoreductase (DUF2520 family)